MGKYILSCLVGVATSCLSAVLAVAVFKVDENNTIFLLALPIIGAAAYIVTLKAYKKRHHY